MSSPNTANGSPDFSIRRGAEDDETGAFDAVMVRADPIRNQVALAMHRGSEQVYNIFEKTLRRALRSNW